MRRAAAALLLLAAMMIPARGDDQDSATYWEPLCRTWIKIHVDGDLDTIKGLLRTNPARLTTAGYCGGYVHGIADTLGVYGHACLPAAVTTEQIVRMVLAHLERNPQVLHEDFIVAVAAVLIGNWPCPKPPPR